ncbi:MAG: DNA mismatch repair protein MutS [Bacteroidota bacterium]|nr:DNA mismatch repair protein MutS [Bacteroidota bacterium]MDP4232134.1 DNA mismatch repair protein MutS [Bacteroidota bacterium]MDP4241158.1 DNA mismatch repair protein MutS [Bacteroidota bacterium]MDP4286550.1 DNA mismatch repair protein MutS [Bacteroidota bacterium]
MLTTNEEVLTPAKADKLTPLMKQYNSIKAKYPETVLFFRMGDFFETFGPDAITTAKVTGIVLTKRGNGSASEIELAGFPHHQLDTYLPKMIRAGYRVAVCEQLEDPKLAKGIVQRGVVEVVTPGVATSEKILEIERNTYAGAIVLQSGVAGIAYADVSTGEFVAGEIPEAQLAEHLETIGMRELLVARKDISKTELAPYFVALSNKPAITRREDWIFHFETARELLLQHFQTASLKGFGIDDLTVGITAAGAVLDYLRETRSQSSLSHVTRVSRYEPKDYLALDASTRRNLELFSSLQGGNPNASLLGALDETSSPMGARMLRRWLARPLRSHERITQRLAAVETMNANREARDKLCQELRELGDIERLVGRFAGARILQPRDFLALKFSLWHLPEIQKALAGLIRDQAEVTDTDKSILGTIAKELRALPELAEELDRFVSTEPPATVAHLGVIRDGANPDLDELRALTRNSRERLLAIQARERERTGIATLKVDYNNVFGYYIEVSKANQAKVPADYERRQTMTNAERYITPELKEYEAKILGAEERMMVIEREMIEVLRARIIQDISPLTHNAELLAVIDVLATFSVLATKHRWTRPEFNTIGEFAIEMGRHPVVEKLLPVGERFTANSVLFKPGEFEFYVITGPNMSGKSVYLRQCGVLAYLAHVGSFVPAERANFPRMDRIFTRVGASDNVASGESTFLVEMNEAANMLNNATADSLLLFDELGRGTSTFDGLSIAWAVSEYIHDNLPGARTLFATHYHELNALAERHAHIHNLKVEVREAEGKVHFLHKIAPGHADHSYGIEVAAMAGIPPEVIDRAREILRSLEATELVIAEANIQREIPFVEHSTRAEQEARLKQAFGDEHVDAVAADLRALDLNTLTPIEAINKIAEWKKKLE